MPTPQRAVRIMEHLYHFIHKDEVIISYKKVKGKGVLPHYHVETTGGCLTIPLKWKGVKR